MTEKKCPYCGNENIIRKTIKDENGFLEKSDWCSICNNLFGRREISQEAIEFLMRSGDQEWEEYANELGIDNFSWGQSSLWKKYLFIKNEKDEVALDVSEQNIKKCEQLYREYPDDENNLIRLMLLKIFLERECGDLILKFTNIWEKELIIGSLCCALVLDEKIYRAIEPYILHLKNFLLFLQDKNSKHFCDEISELGDPCSFKSVLKIIGASEVSRIMDVKYLYDSDIYLDEGYLQCYVTAESCYQNKKWFEGFMLFQKLKTFNEMYQLTNEDLHKGLKNDIWFFSDLLHSSPTIEDIKDRLLECFNGLVVSKEKSNLFEYTGTLELNLRFYWGKILEKEKEIKNYSQIYSVFSDLMKENYEEAFEKWRQWDKRGIKLAGLDIWTVTKSIINLKDRIGNKEDNIKALLSANPLMEDFGIISDLEMKLREFIFENLSKYYGGEALGWRKGVPQDIRKKCVSRKEEDVNLETPKHSFLDFSDYTDIICFKENWESIFKKYFIMEKSDQQKGKEKLTSFLGELVPLRNTVCHLRRVLKDDERKRLKELRAVFYKIYEKWRCNYK